MREPATAALLGLQVPGHEKNSMGIRAEYKKGKIFLQSSGKHCYSSLSERS